MGRASCRTARTAGPTRCGAATRSRCGRRPGTRWRAVAASVSRVEDDAEGGLEVVVRLAVLEHGEVAGREVPGPGAEEEALDAGARAQVEAVARGRAVELGLAVVELRAVLGEAGADAQHLRRARAGAEHLVELAARQDQRQMVAVDRV